jgi:hypothetical protein
MFDLHHEAMNQAHISSGDAKNSSNGLLVCKILRMGGQSMTPALIEEKAYIRQTVRHPGFHSRSLLLVGLTFPPSQFRRYDFRVIECGDDVPMAAQVGTKKRRLSPSTSAAMRKEDQRVASGLCRSIADSHLAPWRGASRNGEEVLSRQGDILARVLRGRGIPDRTREQAVAHHIQRLDGAHTHRKSTPGELIALVHPGGRPWCGRWVQMLDMFPGH